MVAEDDSTYTNDDNEHRFYEGLYDGDHLITETVGLFELQEMLLIIGNIVSKNSPT